MYRIIKRILTTITTVTWTIRWEDGVLDAENDVRSNDLRLTSSQITKEVSIEAAPITDHTLLQDHTFKHDE